jgi:urease accessory protein UreE
MRINGEQLEHLQQVVSLGEYRIDADQVATAMLERIGAALERQAITERGGDRVLKRALTDLRVA